MPKSYIDFRSDTITQPTDSMRQAMRDAVVGDDVLREDPTVLQLESLSAELFGKAAALFVPSGTMGNECSIMAHTQSGNEVIVAEKSHIVQREAGAAALLARVQLRTVSPDSPHPLPKDIKRCLRTSKNIHFPETGLICVEQAAFVGTLVPVEVLEEIHSMAKEAAVPVHMDGARIFNAAAALDMEPKELAKHADSVTFCLSKGLCAPVGSVIVGSEDFIEKARHYRKILGGGMRQAGFLAAAGIVAINEIAPKLGEDHKRAKLLIAKLSELPQVRIPHEPEINMVFIDIRHLSVTGEQIVAKLQERNIKAYPDDSGIMRFVTHQQISDDDVQKLVDALRDILKEQ